jgi:hypothetical protein
MLSYVALAKVSVTVDRLARLKKVFEGIFRLRPFSPEMHERRGMEGWPPAIRVRRSVPPAGLFEDRQDRQGKLNMSDLRQTDLHGESDLWPRLSQ